MFSQLLDRIFMTLQVSPNDLIEEGKLQIESESEIPADQLRLIYEAIQWGHE
jgi:hypothetical protein